MTNFIYTTNPPLHTRVKNTYMTRIAEIFFSFLRPSLSAELSIIVTAASKELIGNVGANAKWGNYLSTRYASDDDG